MIRIWLILLFYAKFFCFCDSSCQYFAFGEAAKLVSQKTGSSSFKLTFSSASASSSIRIPKFISNTEGNFTFLKRTSNSNQEMKCGILFQRSNRQTSENNIKILDHLLEQTKHIHQQQALSSDSASLTVLLDSHNQQHQESSSSPIHLSNSASFATFYSNGAGVSLGENSVSLLFTGNLAILRFEGEEVEHLEQQAREISTSPKRKSSPVKFLQTDLKDGQYLLAVEYIGIEGIHFPSPSVSNSSSGGASSSSFSTSASSSSTASGSSDDDKLVRQAMTEPNFSKKVFDWPVFRKNHHQYLKTITHNLIYRLSEGNSSDQRLREIVVMAVIRVPYSPVSTISLPVILVIFVVFLVFVVAFVLQNKSVN